MSYAKHVCRMKTATFSPAFDSGGIMLFHGDVKEILPTLTDQTIDACITDPPYGVTAARFDQPPFTSDLVSSNRKQFRCEWIWNKHLVTGNLNASVRPMRKHEKERRRVLSSKGEVPSADEHRKRFSSKNVAIFAISERV